MANLPKTKRFEMLAVKFAEKTFDPLLHVHYSIAPIQCGAAALLAVNADCGYNFSLA